jgi:hypothetical protein
MKHLILFILAVLLFILIAPIGIAYTAFYYIWHEKERNRPYLYRCAFVIDICANVMFGELFETIFAKKRKFTLFGEYITISASIGQLIHVNNIKNIGIKFSKLLDKIFNEQNHCINAYINRK